ncbi:MAG TPA: hypothetical protein PLR60_01340 [Syntrophorhabdaceae bacterium]|nr:hypothetical protein [Syntrophorhabdaceae bacterium]
MNMLKSYVLCLLFIAVFFSNTLAGERVQAKPDDLSPPVRGLRITGIEMLKEQVYALVSVEFPKEWPNPKFTVEVSGKPMRSRIQSGGFSTDRAVSGILFVPGKAGSKSVTVKIVADGKKAEAKTVLDWKPGPFLTILQHTGDREMIFAKEKFTLLAANINDVMVLLNGNDVYSKVSGGDMTLRSFEPVWKKGKNTLTVIAKGPGGSASARNYTFFYLGGGGALAVDETAVLCYGREGSKSGPFYDLFVEGDTVTPGKEAAAQVYALDKEGWLASETRLTREFKGRQAGTSKIRVMVKHHFLGSMEQEREMTITVKESNR